MYYPVLQLEERLLKTAKDKMEQLSKVLSGSKMQNHTCIILRNYFQAMLMHGQPCVLSLCYNLQNGSTV